MKTLELIATLSFIGLGLSVTQAQTTAFGADSLSSTGDVGIGFNFVGTGDGSFGATSGVASLTPTQTAGVLYQANWNNDATSSDVTSGSISGLLDNTGTATGVNVSFSGPNTFSTDGSGPYASYGGDGQLLNGYMDSNTTTPASATFSNLGTSTYDVYVYLMASGTGRDGIVSLSGATTGNGTFYWSTLDPDSATAGTGLYGGYTEATSTVAGTFTPGNYVEFTGVTGSSFDIANLQSGGQSDGIAGIQLVEIAAPEPSTWMLMAGGVGILLFVLRRRYSFMS